MQIDTKAWIVVSCNTSCSLNGRQVTMGILVKSAPLNQQYAFLWSSLEIPCPWRCAMWRKITLCRLEITGRLGPWARWTQLGPQMLPIARCKPHFWYILLRSLIDVPMTFLELAGAQAAPTMEGQGSDSWQGHLRICYPQGGIRMPSFAQSHARFHCHHLPLWFLFDLHTAMESFPLSPFTWNCHLLTVESLWCTVPGHSLLPALSGKAAALTPTRQHLGSMIYTVSCSTCESLGIHVRCYLGTFEAGCNTNERCSAIWSFRNCLLFW